MELSNSCEAESPSVAIACRQGNVAALGELLKAKAPVDTRDDRGWRPIHEAAAMNQTECLSLLINDGGSDLAWVTFESETALTLAVKFGHLEATLLLLKAGSDPNVYNNQQDSILHIAVRVKNIHIVEALLDAGASVINKNHIQETPLHVAVAEDSIEILSLLLDRGAPMDSQCHLGRTPLLKAVKNNEISCIRLFTEKLKCMDDISVINVCESHTSTPLMVAAQNGRVDVLKLLVDAGADVNHMTRNGCTAAIMAIYTGHSERNLLEYLYDCGENPNVCLVPTHIYDTNLMIRPPIFEDYFTTKASCLNFKQDECHLSVLSSAIMNETSHYMSLTLQPDDVNSKFNYLFRILQSGADVNPKSLNILSPIHAAIYNSQMGLIELLLELGANLNYPRNMEPNSCAFAVHAAIAYPFVLVKVLKAGGDIRLCFNHSSYLHFISDGIRSHINCLNVIVNTFSGKQLSVLYNHSVHCFMYELLISDEPNVERTGWIKAEPIISHCRCKRLVADIDAMSLQHLCRVKTVHHILEANNWMPLQQCLTKLSLPKQITDFLLYK